MQRFRKKPVVIEAVQFTGEKDNFNAIWDWACPSNDTLQSPVHCGNQEDGSDDYTVLYVQTLEGSVLTRPGDWIIKGTAGEFYPCKPGIFDVVYEPAD